MRLLKKPYGGYADGSDVGCYYKMDSLQSSMDVASDCPTLSDPDSTLVNAPTGILYAKRPIPLFLRFTGTQVVSAASMAKPLDFSDAWTAAVWFSCNPAQVDSYATLFEFGGGVGASTNPSDFTSMRLAWIPAEKRFCLNWQRATGSTFTTHSSALSLSSGVVAGMAAVTFDRTVENRFSFFFDGVKLNDVVETNIPDNVGSSGWIRWGAGRVAALSSLGGRLHGDINEFCVWRRALSPAKVAGLYADSIRPEDPEVLYRNGEVKANYRVLIEDITGALVDYSVEGGFDWVRRVEIQESVESSGKTATVTLSQTQASTDEAGPSPLNLSPTNPAASFPLDIRRRIRIERWVTGVEEAPPTDVGWEIRFDGYIDSYTAASNGALNLSCTDRAAPLLDQKILDAKSYYFPNPTKLAEQHIDEIITDFVPEIQSPSTRVVIGYKGGIPLVHTDYASTASRYFRNSGWLLRYNDVGTDAVFTAGKAMADSIGYDFRFRFYEPWGEDRLEFFPPPREKQIRIRHLRAKADGAVEVTTEKPHGLSPGVYVSVLTAGTLSFVDWPVVEVNSYHRFTTLDNLFGSTASAFPTAAVVQYAENYTLRPGHWKTLGDLSGNISSIRNHIVCRYNRENTPATFTVALAKSTGTAAFTLTLPPTVDVSTLDPDRLGVEFTLSGGTGTATVFNGISSVGKTFGSSVIRSDLQFGGPTAATLTMECEFIRFQQVSSTATASIARYGLQPAGIYEGRVTNIDTFEEAKRLTDRILSDLSDPSADYQIQTKPLPLEIHDVIEIPPGEWVASPDQRQDNLGEPLGRLPRDTPTRAAVVAYREVSEGGDCYTDWTLRNERPSLGTRTLRAAIQDTLRPGLHNNMVDAPALLGPRFTNIGARRLNFAWKNSGVGKPRWRTDFTEVHLSETPDYTPTRETLVASVRGTNVEVTLGPDGLPLDPSKVYYPRLRNRDVDGNLSLSSAASLPSVRAFYTTLVPEARVERSTSTLERSGFGWLPLEYDVDTTATTTYDYLDNYNPSSASWGFSFTAPVTGVYRVSGLIVAGIERDKSAGTVLFAVAQYRAGELNKRFVHSNYNYPDGPSTRTFAIPHTADVFCLAGDVLRQEVNPNDAGSVYLWGGTSASIYGHVHYILTSHSR